MPDIRWPDLRNARDLSDTPTVDGRAIGTAALIRTDNHDRLGPDGIAALRAYGVSRIVDLRWEWEAAKHPSPFAADPIYRLAPACFDVEPDDVIPSDTYALMLDRSAPRLAEAVRAVAEAPPGGVVVHCHAGRDRTGVLVALLLAIAGATLSAIAQDFERSPDARVGSMQNTFKHLAARYGGVEGYLLTAGVTAAQMDALRGRLVG